MRSLALVAALVTLGALARTAAADKKCYAGTETISGKSYAIVSLREVDRSAREVRMHTWSAHDPWRDNGTVYHIADDGKTFTFGGRFSGKGTLDGPAWAWTGYHAEGTALGVSVTADGKLTGTTMTVTLELAKGGKTLASGTLTGTTFDCAELDRRRAALDDTAADAVRTCYAGTFVDTLTPKPRQAVLEQIVEGKRIRLRRWIAGMREVFAQDLAIDGTSITVTEPARASVHGSGTLQGKPGAWTSYTWSARLPVLKGSPPLVLTAEGTLGGPRATMKMVSHARRSLEATFEGSAFACKDLESRNAAIAPAP